MQIENKIEFFSSLWMKLECTWEDFNRNSTRFCPRRILQAWYGRDVDNEFISEVCLKAELLGYNVLEPPIVTSDKLRELIRAIVSARYGCGIANVLLRDIDEAYRRTYPYDMRRKLRYEHRLPCDTDETPDIDFVPFLDVTEGRFSSIKAYTTDWSDAIL